MEETATNNFIGKWFRRDGDGDIDGPSSNDLDYDLRDEREKEGLDLGGETSDYDENWWGVERRG